MAPAREKVIQAAERFVARGKVEAAIREYRKVLAENPRDTNTLNRVGDLYARIDRIDEAVSLFTRIAQHYTDDGFFVKAIAIYKKIIKLDPTRLEIYERLAELYHKQGLVNEARTQYQVLADYYLKHGNIEGAAGICRHMVELEPGNPSHRAKLADLLQQKGDVAGAMAEYRAIADQLIASGQAEGASRVFEKALDLEPQDLDFVAEGIQRLRTAGHTAAAARLLAAAAKHSPGVEGALQQLLTPTVRPEESPTREIPALRPATPAPAAPAPAATVAELEEVWLEDHGRVQPAPAQRPFKLEPPAELSELELHLDEADTEVEAGPATAAGPGALPGVEFDLEMDEVFVFDLDDETPPPTQVAPPPDMAPALSLGAAQPGQAFAPPPAADEEELEMSFSGLEEAVVAAEPDSDEPDFEPAPGMMMLDIDAELIERTAREVGMRHVQQEEDLLTEAEVLAKYGLKEKALERLAEIFELNPRNLRAYSLEIGLRLEEERFDRVAILANEMAGIAAELGQTPVYTEVRDRLLNLGFTAEANGRLVYRAVTPASADPEPPVELAPAGTSDPLPAIAEAPVWEALPDLDSILIEPEQAPEPAPAFEPQVQAELLAFESESEFDVSFAEVPEELPAPEPPAISPPPPPPVAEAPARPRKKAVARDLDATLAELVGTVGSRPARRPAPPPPVPRVAPPVTLPPLVQAVPEPVVAVSLSGPALPSEHRAAAEDLFDLKSLGAELEGEMPVAPTARASAPAPLLPARPPAPSVLSSPPPMAIDAMDGIEIFDLGGAAGSAASDTSWLDDVAPGSAAAGAGEGKLFEDEDGFFDLAAELERELQAEEGAHGESLFAQPHEQSLEEIVEGFKRGVAEHLSPEDYETHYNLGIAYREMGLLDEAIGEFQLAAKNADRLVDCCSMLGMCFVDKGLPELAVKWYRRGLEHQGLSEAESLGLLYDLGSAYVLTGDRDSAYKTFVEIYGVNTNYRDVVARLEELGR